MSDISDNWDSEFGVKELNASALGHCVVLNLTSMFLNDNCQHLLGTFFMPGTILSPFHRLVSNLHTALRRQLLFVSRCFSEAF